MKPIDSQQASVSDESTKKAYQKPELEVYGGLGKITQTVHQKAHPDGGSGNKANTA
jgi:hypothetical protein